MPGREGLTITFDGKWTEDEIDWLGTALTSQNVDRSQKVKMISVSLDHRRMAILKNDGKVILWSPSETKELAAFNSEKGGEGLIRFAEDGKLIVSAKPEETNAQHENPKPISSQGTNP